MLAEILEKEGFRVRPAENAQLAIDSALAQPPSLILLDVRMPGMDGFEVCRRLKQDKRTRDAPIIFVSSLQDGEAKVQGFAAGGIDFISKPFHEAEVRARVGTHMHLRRMRQHLEELVEERTRELRKSEERYELVVEGSSVGIYDWDIITNKVYYSGLFKELLGYDAEEPWDRLEDAWSRIHPDDYQTVVANIERYNEKATSNSLSHEFRLKTKSGEYRWYEWHGKAIWDKDGKPVRMAGSITDITERMQRERDLLRAQQIAHLGFYDWDLREDRLYASEELVRLIGTGFEGEYASSEYISRIVHPDDLDFVRENLELAIKDEKEYDIEHRILRPDGTVIWVASQAILLRDADGVPERLVGTGIDITERRNSLKQLEESERKYRELVEDINDVIYSVDTKGIVVYVSPAIEHLIGYEPHEVVGKHFSDFVHSEDMKAMKDGFESALVGKNVPADYRIVNKAGSCVWVRALSKAIKDKKDNVIGIRGVLSDITERKHAEEALQLSESQLKKAQRIAGLGFLTWNLKTNEMSWTDEVYTLYGVDKNSQKVTLEYTVGLVHPDDLEYVQQSLDKAVKGLERYDIDHRMVRPDGEVIWVHTNAELVCDEDGKPESLLGTVLDITERKESELRIREMASFAELNPAPVLMVDTDGIIMSCNPASLEILGKGAQKGTSLSSLLPGLSEVDLKMCMYGNMLLEREVDIEARSYLFIFRGVSDLGLAYIYGSDITRRKQSERQMSQMRSELLHASRTHTMGELTAALAHELNHPLGSILNNANAARRYLEQDNPDLDEIRDIISDIISEDRRANEVMQKVRSLMKKTEVGLAPVKINSVIEEVLKLTHSEFIIENVSLSKQLAKDLPRVAGERIQLQQVLINLIINAIDAMKESKTKSLHISTAQQDAENIKICIRDTGCGFSDEAKDNLFKPFFTTKKEGMGIGLSVTRTIIKSHGGEIWTENNEEAGANFFITLPCYKEKSV